MVPVESALLLAHAFVFFLYKEYSLTNRIINYEIWKWYRNVWMCFVSTMLTYMALNALDLHALILCLDYVNIHNIQCIAPFALHTHKVQVRIQDLVKGGQVLRPKVADVVKRAICSWGKWALEAFGFLILKYAFSHILETLIFDIYFNTKSW